MKLSNKSPCASTYINNGKTMKQAQLLAYWLYPRNSLETKCLFDQNSALPFHAMQSRSTHRIL